MKRYLIAFFVLLSSVAISQDIANHSMPIGGGPGAVGWKTGGPCSAGQALVWAGAGVDPTCISVSGSGSTPGGANGDIQYNNAGTFGGINVGTGLVNSGTALNCTNATAVAKGCVQTDGATVAVSAGVISCRTGTASVLGCLQVDGTTITVAAGVISAAAPTVGIQVPGGRLVGYNNSVACGVAESINLTDVASADWLCYVAHKSTTIPIGGSNYAFAATLTSPLSAAHQTAGNAYDVYAVLLTGAPIICINGAAWPTLTSLPAARSIVKSGALYVNSATLTHCWNSTTDRGGATAGNATYLGSIYALGNGSAQWMLTPDAATGGTANCLCIYNAYNREPVMSVERELTSNWTYSTATWRPWNNSVNNHIRTIDGLGLSQQKIWTIMTIDTGDNQVNGGTTNVCIDCVSPGSVIQVSNQAGFGQAGSAANQGQTLPGQGFYSGIGMHYFMALEIGGGGTATEWFGNTYSGLFLQMEN